MNYVSKILPIFDPPYPHVSVRKISQTPPPYSYVRFHLVFQHNKMLLEKDQLHKNSQFDVNQRFLFFNRYVILFYYCQLHITIILLDK